MHVGELKTRVRVDDRDVSLELVKSGLAWHYKKYSSNPTLASAEQQARAEGAGIWSLPDLIPPWEQRRGSSGTWERAVESSSQSGIVYHGNKSSRIYHDPGCRYYNCKTVPASSAVRKRRTGPGTEGVRSASLNPSQSSPIIFPSDESKPFSFLGKHVSDPARHEASR